MAAAKAGKREIGHNDRLAKISMPPAPRSLAVAAAFALAACLACGGKVPPTLYYVLDLPVPTAVEDRLAGTAILMPIRVSEVVGQGRVVYRESREQVGFYEYHRWAEDPEDSVARAFLGELMARGTFASVVPFDGRTKADFLLRGEIRRLEEIDYGGPVRAVAEVAIELVNASTRQVAWSSAASHTEEVPASEVRSVVSSMSVAARKAIKQLADGLDRHFRAEQ